MDDIVIRLRTSAWLKGSYTGDMLHEAADEIERLHAEINSLVSAQSGWGRVPKLEAEIERLRQSVIEMRQLLEEFWKTCTEEHNSVEMFVLHRATGHAIARAYDAAPEDAASD